MADSVIFALDNRIESVAEVEGIIAVRLVDPAWSRAKLFAARGNDRFQLLKDWLAHV